jgi:hypothetical protein
VTRNHLLIGLGGTGTSIVRAFRALLQATPQAETPSDLQIEYLVVDAHADSLSASRFGDEDSLSGPPPLRPNQTIQLAPQALHGLIDVLARQPTSPAALAFSALSPIVRTQDYQGGTQQSRGIGGLLFAANVNRYRDAIGRTVAALESTGTRGVTFHVLAGLAGGTGSGCLVDAICQLRLLFPGRQYRVIVYVSLPERNPSRSVAGPNYKPNAYAALLELNALSTGVLPVRDISSPGTHPKEIKDPFNCCYVYSNESEDGRLLGTEFLAELAAQFLYIKIADTGERNRQRLERLESFENVDARPEYDALTGQVTRSRMFLTFGVTSIFFPKARITDYLTYSLARQGALDLTFNNWSGDLAFLQEPREPSTEIFPIQDVLRARWLVDDEHVMLSTGILPNETTDPKWVAPARYWSSVFAHFLNGRSARNEPQRIAARLRQIAEQAYSDEFRGRGVPGFYLAASEQTKEYVASILARISDDLSTRFLDGSVGLHEASRTLLGIAEDSWRRAAEFDPRIDRLEQTVATTRSEAEGHLSSMARLGFLDRLLRKSDQLLAAYTQALESQFRARTEAEACRFARRLLYELASEARLAADRVHQTLSRFLDVASGLRQSMDHILQTLADPDTRRWSFTVGNFSALADAPIEILQQPLLKDALRSLVRYRLRDVLSGPRGLDQFGLLTETHIRNVLLSAGAALLSDKASELANLAKTASLWVNGNAVDVLLQQAAGNEDELRRILDRFVRSAQVMIVPDPVEIARRHVGLPRLEWQRHISVYVPDVSAGDVLRSMLRSMTREPAEIWSTRTTTQVAALSIAGPFPLRWLSNIRDLREPYADRAAHEDGWTQIHTVAFGATLPDLFLLNEPLALFLQNAGASVVRHSAKRYAVTSIPGRLGQFSPFPVHVTERPSEADVDALLGDCSNAVGVLIYSIPPDLGTRLDILKARLQKTYSVITIPYRVVEHCLLDPPSCAGTLAEFADRYLPGADLFDERNAISDGLFFFGRTELLSRLQAELLRNNSVGLFGLRKSGKTSVLLQLEYAMRQVPVVRIDLQRFGSETDFAGAVFDDILLQLRRLADSREARTVGREQADSTVQPCGGSSTRFAAAVELLARDLKRAGYQLPIVLCLDEIERILPLGDATSTQIIQFNTCMGTLRSLSQDKRLVSLLVTDVHPDCNRTNHWPAPTLATNPVFAFFKEVFMPPFSEEDTTVMIEFIGRSMGLLFDEPLISEIHRKTGGQPFLARQLAAVVVKASERNGNHIGFDGARRILASPFEYSQTLRSYFEESLWPDVIKRHGGVARNLLHCMAFEGAPECEYSFDEVRTRIGASITSGSLMEAIQWLVDIGVLSRRAASSGEVYKVAMPLVRDWLQWNIVPPGGDQ